MTTAIVIVAIFLTLAIITGILKLWIWLGLVVWVGIGLGIAEAMSYKLYAMSISNRFRSKRRSKQEVLAWAFLLVLYLGTGMLTMHLMIK